MGTTSSPLTPQQQRARNIRRWIVVGLLSLGMIRAYIDRVNLSVALAVPDFKTFFGLTDVDRGLLNSAFFWSYAFLQIPAGWLVDRYGVRMPYAVCFFFWSLVSAGTALCTSISQLFTLRVLLGVGESVVAPASMRWIRFNFPEEQRGRAVGLYMTGTKIGPAIGPPLAVWLLSVYGWRPMFLILGLGFMVWLIPWMMLVKDDDRRLEKKEAAARPAAAYVPFSKIMASPVIWGTIIGTFCYMYFVYFCLTWMPAYFLEKHHVSLSSMGWYVFFSFGGMAVIAFLAGWWADILISKGWNPVAVRKGFTIAGFVLASTEIIGGLTSSVPVALFFSIFSLSGLGLATANYWALTQTLIPGGAIGRIVGIQNCAANLPGIAAPIITGWILAKTGSYDATMQVIWVFLLIGIASYVFLVREKYAPKV
jgi:MFS transporter, ACS family, D-galactonate transporter